MTSTAVLPDAADTADGRPPLAVDAVTDFLRSQTSALRCGLRRAGEPAAVRPVLAAHDAAHERWLSVVAAVLEADPATAFALTDLYALVGRVAGVLEGAALWDLPPGVADRARQLLGATLQERTEACVAAVRAAAPGSGDAAAG